MLTRFQLILLPVALVFAEVSSKTCIGHGCITKKRSIDNELEICVPGSKWREDCNSCTCSKHGRIVCTHWQCDPDQPNLMYRTISVGRRLCSAGDPWFEHCNICICLGLERAVCTKYDCQKYNWVYSKLRKRRQTGINAERKCTPGTTWKEDCNTCFCSGNGFVGCTLMACHSHLHRPKRDEERKCTPGTTWKEDCNTCFCADNGFVGCTLMACPSHLHRPKRDEAEEEQSEVSLQELEKNCEIGTTIKLDCNICYCTAMGFACTKRLCHGHEVSVVVEE